jgi:hypothetical protein
MEQGLHFDRAIDERTGHDVLRGMERSIPDMVIVGRKIKRRLEDDCLLHFYC